MVVNAVDDGTAGSDTFTWAVGPEINSLNPNTVPEGSGSFTLTIDGGGFQVGNTTVTVDGNSVVNLVPTVLSGTELTVNVPATLLQQDGPLAFTVSVPDSSGIPGHYLFSFASPFTITPPSSLVFTYANQMSLEGSSVSVASSNLDPNVGNWTATGLPPGLSINPNNGTIAGTIARTGVGNYTVVVSAVDDTTPGSDTFSWTVGPEITSVSPNTAVEGSGSIVLTINGIDFQPGSTTVTISGNSVVSLLANVVSSTQLTVTAPASVLQQDGPLAVTVAVPDGSGGALNSNVDTFSITPPSSLVFTYANELDSAGSIVSVSSSNTDPNVSNWTATGLPPGLSINPYNGTISGTISLTGEGNYTVVVNANDDGTPGGDTFSWAVTPPNEPPTFALQGNSLTLTTDNGPNLVQQSVSNWAQNISPGPPDQSSETVTFQVSDNNSTLFAVQPAISSDGTLTYTPAAFADGSAIVTVTAMNSGSNNPPNQNTSGSQTFTLNLTPINQQPSFADLGDQTILESGSASPAITTVTGWAESISAGPSYEAWQTLNFVVSNNNPNLFTAAGQPTVSLNGTLSYQQAQYANGSATVTVTLMDNGGTANGGQDAFTETFDLTITPVNQPPSFALNSSLVPVTTLENPAPTVQTVSNLTTNINVGAPNQSSETLTFNVSNNNTILFTEQPTIAPNGTLTYEAAPFASGTATVTVTLQNSGSGMAPNQNTSAAQTFTITLTPVNLPPSFSLNSSLVPITVLESAAPTVQTVAHLATNINVGAPNQSSESLTFNVSDNDPSLFSMQPTISANGTLTYEAAQYANGTATVTVTLQNSGSDVAPNQNTSAAQTFVIDITPVNQPPSFTAGPNQTIFESGSASPPVQTVPNWATNISAGRSQPGVADADLLGLQQQSRPVHGGGPAECFRQRHADVSSRPVRLRQRQRHRDLDGQRRHGQRRSRHLRSANLHH